MFSRRRAYAEQSFKGVKLDQNQLDQFVTAHERFVRRQPRGRRIILRFLQAPGLSVAGRVLAEAELTGVCLYGADLRYADLSGAQLYCADLRRIQGEGVDLSRADLRGAALRGAVLNGAVMDRVDLRAATLAVPDEARGLRLLRNGRDPDGAEGGAIGGPKEAAQFPVDFSGASLVGARLDGANLRACNFEGAILSGATLAGARLEGARMNGAVLVGVDVAALKLSGAALQGCVLDPSDAAQARVPELMARLAAAELWWRSDGQSGAACCLDGEDLRVIAEAFPGRSLTALQARNVQAAGVNFVGAHLQGACFDGADLRGAGFEGADLRGARFVGARLNHARFDAAQLGPLRLGDGAEKPTRFDGATGFRAEEWDAVN